MQGAWSHACIQFVLITSGRELGYASWAIVFSSTAGTTSLPFKFLSTIKRVIMIQDSITNPPLHILTFEHHRTSMVSSLKLSMNGTLPSFVATSDSLATFQNNI